LGQRLLNAWLSKNSIEHRVIDATIDNCLHDSKYACVLMADVLNTCCNIVNESAYTYDRDHDITVDILLKINDFARF